MNWQAWRNSIGRRGRSGRGIALVLSLGCGFIALAAAPAAAGELCEASGEFGYDIEVVVEVAPVRVDRKRSKAELTGLSFHGQRGTILGLMQSNFQIETLASSYSQVRGDGVCFWVDGIRVVLRYSSLDIFIAREYESHSCESRVIMEHEREHVKVAKRVVQPYIPKMKSALTSLSIPRGDNPWLVESTEAGEARLWETVRKLLAPLRRELAETLGREQAVVDSPQSYALVRKRCKNW